MGRALRGVSGGRPTRMRGDLLPERKPLPPHKGCVSRFVDASRNVKCIYLLDLSVLPQEILFCMCFYFL